MIIAINEIAKNPKIINNTNEIIYIEDKRKHELKSIVIPAMYKDYIEEAIKEIEYEMWLKRNKAGLSVANAEFLDEAINDIGKQL